MDKLAWLVHIPKTGGTSLYASLSRAVSHNETLPYSDRQIQEFGETSTEIDVRPYRLMRAHFDTSLLPLLIGRQVQMVTVLRNPVDRVASLYAHFRNGSLAQQRAVGDQTLSEFLDMQAWNWPCHNQMTRMICGRYSTEFGIPPDHPDMVDQAKMILSEDFVAFHVIDEWDTLIKLVRAGTGLDVPLEFNKVNVTPIQDKVQVSDDDLDAILIRNELDMALYKWARDRELD